MSASAWGDQKRASDPLDQELHVFVSHLMLALGAELRPSAD